MADVVVTGSRLRLYPNQGPSSGSRYGEVGQEGHRLAPRLGEGDRLPLGEGERDKSVRSRAGRAAPTRAFWKDDLRRVRYVSPNEYWNGLTRRYSRKIRFPEAAYLQKPLDDACGSYLADLAARFHPQTKGSLHLSGMQWVVM
ncbi:hypothetical protein RhiXN_03995 [Rhizoctonia solani]|uniref:Uncharacterized protein n=1 Tax=Rhizoctonia solani TaxID=456999 RepID=A0A8H8NLN9_9AGAM|nr:uncharacterized protein RhiXN_03995 [Rhizoctonia solani]QRW15994.1 hypothetical protein RhiXN_03995 [Rhizoctonia solani]